MPVRAVLTNLVRLICLACILVLAFAAGRYLREPTLDGGIVLGLGMLVCGFVITRLVGPGGVASFRPARGRAPGEAVPAKSAGEGPKRSGLAALLPRRSDRAPKETKTPRAADRAREAVAAPAPASEPPPPLWKAEPRAAEPAAEAARVTPEPPRREPEPPRREPEPPRREPEPPRAEPAPPHREPEPRRSAAAPGGRVNVNTASLEELAALRGVGPVAAERIMAEREANGPFGSLEALTRVEGFAGSRIARIRAQGVVAE